MATTFAQFVHGQPLDVPTIEVLRRAHASGIKGALQSVYALRSAMRKQPSPASPASPASPIPRDLHLTTRQAQLCDQLRKLVLRVGLDEARRVIAQLEARSEQVLHG